MGNIKYSVDIADSVIENLSYCSKLANNINNLFNMSIASSNLLDRINDLKSIIYCLSNNYQVLKDYLTKFNDDVSLYEQSTLGEDNGIADDSYQKFHQAFLDMDNSEYNFLLSTDNYLPVTQTDAGLVISPSFLTYSSGDPANVSSVSTTSGQDNVSKIFTSLYTTTMAGAATVLSGKPININKILDPNYASKNTSKPKTVTDTSKYTNRTYISTRSSCSASVVPEVGKIYTNCNTYNLTASQKKQLIAIVYAEAAYNTSTYITDPTDALGVASVILNRMDSTNNDFKNVNTVSEVVSQKNQFSSYGNSKYNSIINGNVSSSSGNQYERASYEVCAQAVEVALSGTRNMGPDVLYFAAGDNETRYGDSWK